MINFKNLEENFIKYKDVIIELLVECYGEKYRNIILYKMNNIFMDFSSIPTDDYEYLLLHDKEINFRDKVMIKLNYLEYKKQEKELLKKYEKELLEYVMLKFSISKHFKYKNSNLFLSLFMGNNFSGGYIDAFCSEYVSLLNDSNVSKDVKVSILGQQKLFFEFVNKLELSVKDIPVDLADEIVKYRNFLRKEYQMMLVEKTTSGKDMIEKYKKHANIIMPEEAAREIFFHRFPFTAIIYGEYFVIKIPIIYLKNMGAKAIDVSVIHEIIHYVESNKNYVGICDYIKGVNKLVNEIRTQKLAIKITNKLHELGVFMYDNPNDYKILGECLYEKLFPLTGTFFEDYEDFLNNVAISNDVGVLDKFLGPAWGEYSKYMDIQYHNFRFNIENFDVEIEICLDEMVKGWLSDMKGVYYSKVKLRK